MSYIRWENERTTYYCQIFLILVLILKHVVDVMRLFYEPEWAAKGYSTYSIETDYER